MRCLALSCGCKIILDISVILVAVSSQWVEGNLTTSWNLLKCILQLSRRQLIKSLNSTISTKRNYFYRFEDELKKTSQARKVDIYIFFWQIYIFVVWSEISKILKLFEMPKSSSIWRIGFLGEGAASIS